MHEAERRVADLIGTLVRTGASCIHRRFPFPREDAKPEDDVLALRGISCPCAWETSFARLLKIPIEEFHDRDRERVVRARAAAAAKVDCKVSNRRPRVCD